MCPPNKKQFRQPQRLWVRLHPRGFKINSYYSVVSQLIKLLNKYNLEEKREVQ